MKKFIPVEFKIVFLEEEDVIRTSSIFGEGDQTGDREPDTGVFGGSKSAFGLN